ncbi:signal transduction histidine kinase [Aureibacillus halotolerans]|uniref:histidine kinase n=2 Tax=Aureibacillus halotolerans TaxID=1508390 RepID=A0A4R6TVH1_9BACI|nr:signal transduction histidine kinase [Aureibacillus halotolerans]
MLLSIILLAALWQQGLESVTANRMVMIACFYALFFIAPLLSNAPRFLTVGCIFQSVLIMLLFWQDLADPISTSISFSILLFLLVFAYALAHLPSHHVIFVGSCALLAAIMPPLFAGDVWPIVATLLLAVIVLPATMTYYSAKHALQFSTIRYDTLLSEYKSLKRGHTVSETLARQQERTRIAEQMHDSVGHQLTALIFQLEVFRMRLEGQDQATVGSLKKMAQESLNETRRAVQHLDKEEAHGIEAIQHLIRQLEAENVLKVAFSVGEGVLSAPLSPEQSVGVYRAIQEAMTNALKHGKQSSVSIQLQLLGGSSFFFRVENEASSKDIHKGFGLSAMEERFRLLGGYIHTRHEHKHFILEGSFPLTKERD